MENITPNKPSSEKFIYDDLFLKISERRSNFKKIKASIEIFEKIPNGSNSI